MHAQVELPTKDAQAKPATEDLTKESEVIRLLPTLI